MSKFIFVILCLLLNAIYSTAHYKTTYVEDLCKTNAIHVWNLGSASPNSSGILKASRNGEFLSGINCSIFIQPPLGYGVILSIRYLDFRPYYFPNCENFVEIFGNKTTMKLCGYSDDITEYQSYFTDGKAMELRFYTTNRTGAEFHSDITFIATSYLRNQCEMKLFKCQNSRCIWRGLKCDGHNNCGDLSDETRYGPAQCGVLPPGATAAIVVGAVMGFLLIVLIPFACCRCHKRFKNPRRSARQPPLIQPALSYGTNEGSSIQECIQADTEPGTSQRVLGDLPPPYKP